MVLGLWDIKSISGQYYLSSLGLYVYVKAVAGLLFLIWHIELLIK